jgi:DNA-binding LacI/PurR family transcriptional regulator
MIKIGTFTTTTTIAAGASETPSVNITVPTSYVIIGFDYSINMGHVITSGIKEQTNVIGYNSATRLVFNVTNNHSATLSPTITVNVTFIKKNLLFN